MATLTISDSTYRRLQVLAASRRVSVDEYLVQMAAGATAPQMPSESMLQLRAIESFAAGMATWSAKLPPGHVADDSRDSIYDDRGE